MALRPENEGGGSLNGHVDIRYGKGTIPLRVDSGKAEWEVIRPRYESALERPEEQFQEAVRTPIGGRPLADIVEATDRVVIVTSDGTRPVPNRQLIPWILDALPVPDDRVTVVIGTGTHRPNSESEIEAMFGTDVVRRVRIVNHNGYDPDATVDVGTTSAGTPVRLSREYVEADRRIAVGFIEPHFFAGFSGGAKGVAPGVAAVETVYRLHRWELIGDPNSTWGVLEENPIQKEIGEAVALCPPDFLVNVTLNSDKEITGFYAGDLQEAHRAGCEKARDAAMAPVTRAFPVVVTSNSGFPLDQNLYQAVKGISAAARITEPGGTIFVACECSDGIPDHGNFARLMLEGDSPDDVTQSIRRLPETVQDQWQAQILAGILSRHRVRVFSALAENLVSDCKMDVSSDLSRDVEAAVSRAGVGSRAAVLPDGPLTIPFLEGTG